LNFLNRFKNDTFDEYSDFYFPQWIIIC